MAQREITDQVYENALAAFEPVELVNLTAIITTINSWNRVAIGFRLTPEIS